MRADWVDNVWALACDDFGNVYAGGSFSEADGVAASGIARWDGAAWHALGSGVNGLVRTLAVDGAGNLYAGGWFTTAGGVAVSAVARWDGAAWSALGAGLDNYVHALAVDDEGMLYAGGRFASAGGMAASRLARWDGVAWSALGSGVDDDVNALAVDTHGDLHVGGRFRLAGGTLSSNYAIWHAPTASFVESGTDQRRAAQFGAAVPNPFNPATVLSFVIPADGPVRLTVHDLRGRLVRTLVAADLVAGDHHATWDGRDARGLPVASGSYLARLSAGHVVQVRRLTLVR